MHQRRGRAEGIMGEMVSQLNSKKGGCQMPSGVACPRARGVRDFLRMRTCRHLSHVSKLGWLGGGGSGSDFYKAKFRGRTDGKHGAPSVKPTGGICHCSAHWYGINKQYSLGGLGFPGRFIPAEWRLGFPPADRGTHTLGRSSTSSGTQNVLLLFIFVKPSESLYFVAI